MKRKVLNAAALALALMAANWSDAYAIGWPENYEGVMLQGFYWDSYDDTQWSKFEAQSDELSQYFKLIWIPNSGHCGSGKNMGYMPQYWFSNHNSSFGTEEQLRSMIKTFKQKGTGFIADVVVNHRNGVTDWYDFPVEEWNGKTWSIGLDGICGNDELASASGKPKPTGAYDTGDGFDGCRDLDHTNANVQENVKNYQKFLLEDLGYAGVRLDMVKGYGGQYTKIYNEYTNVEFSVGEYWDSSYDNVKNWIDATGKTSAAFDFPCKYAINKAFSDNDMTELVWAANGTNDQPAGMIHFGYPRYAVTFVDNHDTYRDGSKFTGNVVAANAFILCSPGTPCVFLPHYQQYKSQIQALIKARNDVGVSNTSKVTVLKKQSDCYMAEVVGSKGKLVVKIGSAMVSPDGYTNDQIAASGNGYCVWTTARQGGGGDDPQPQPQPTGRYVYYDNTKSNWNEVCCYYWIGSDDNTWPGVEMEKIGNVYRFELPEGVDGIIFNNNDNKKQTNNIGNPAVGHVYYCEHDNWEKQDAIDNGAFIPSKLYIIGHLEGGHWTDANVVEMTREGNIFTATGVVIEAPITPAAVAEAASGYFSLITSPDSSWSTEHRFGAAEHDAPINGEMPLYHFGKSVNAQSAYSWKAEAGKYDITADFDNMTLKAEKTQVTSIDDISVSAPDIAPVYYNLQGVEVASPTSGLYIVVRDGKVTKEYLR